MRESKPHPPLPSPACLRPPRRPAPRCRHRNIHRAPARPLWFWLSLKTLRTLRIFLWKRRPPTSDSRSLSTARLPNVQSFTFRLASAATRSAPSSGRCVPLPAPFRSPHTNGSPKKNPRNRKSSCRNHPPRLPPHHIPRPRPRPRPRLLPRPRSRPERSGAAGRGVAPPPALPNLSPVSLFCRQPKKTKKQKLTFRLTPRRFSCATARSSPTSTASTPPAPTMATLTSSSRGSMCTTTRPLVVSLLVEFPNLYEGEKNRKQSRPGPCQRAGNHRQSA